MAEALGAVSGAFGIASFAFQIGESALKFKRLWSSIKDAPKEVTKLVDEVSTFAAVLSDFSSAYAHAIQFIASPSGKECYHCCEALTSELDNILRELEMGLKKGKYRGGIKTVLYKDKISSVRSALHEAKTSLVLAQGSLTMAMQAQQSQQIESTHALVMTISQTNTSSQHNSAGEARCAPTQRTLIISESTADTSEPGKASVLPRKRCSRKPAKASRFVTPTQWLGIIWSIETYRASRGWDFFFRTYRVVPCGSIVFEYARKGDVLGLQDLFTKGLASPFVVDDRNGYTPLHIAAINFQAECVELLLRHGADINARGRHNQTCFEIFWTLRKFFPRETRESEEFYHHKCLRASKVLRLFLAEGTIDYTYDNIMVDLFSWMVTGYHPDVLLIQQEMVSSYTQIDIQDRLTAACTNEGDPELFWLVLGQQNLDQSCLDGKSYQLNQQVINCIARNLARSHYPERYNGQKYIAGWRDILRQAVKLNGHLSFLRNGRSPAITYLNCSHAFNARLEDLNKYLRSWVNELALAGADLVEYGRAEQDHLLCTSLAPCVFIYYGLRKNFFWVRVTNLTYGPKVEDWQIWISWPFDEWAGEFWNWVENPELFMPGAWVEN